jgi:hypothetical protein
VRDFEPVSPMRGIFCGEFCSFQASLRQAAASDQAPIRRAHLGRRAKAFFPISISCRLASNKRARSMYQERAHSYPPGA